MAGDGYALSKYIRMIEFVNAKINIGLQIVGKREDGYHNLQTVFYPIGKYSGLSSNPTEFCDVIEATCGNGKDMRFVFTGRRVDCPDENNLVCKAAKLYREYNGFGDGITICLDKHLPDGAGLGGGSADAAFTLKVLAQLQSNETGSAPLEEDLARMALKLGADCPFFIFNRPMLGEGIGERLTDIAIDLRGFWLVVIKPDIFISTKEAFAGIKPKRGTFDLRELPTLPIEKWQGVIKNDFENSLFPSYPILREIKDKLLAAGASYASMSGSGSSIYGIFRDREQGESAKDLFINEPTIEGAYLLKL